jgi:DNA-binding LacI/PurR family transcriptional regulator
MRQHVLADCIRIIQGNHTEESGLRAAARFLREPELPTAVLTFNDRCGVGLPDALSRSGVDVPGSVSIAGYDDTPLARLAHVNLTTVSRRDRRTSSRSSRVCILDSVATTSRR